MATGEAILTQDTARGSARAASRADIHPVVAALSAIASLRLTVALFATSILLILFGTLAQVHADVWEVVRHTHFQVWVATVEWRSLGRLFEMLFGGEWDNLSGGFYFPGGILIGSLMLLNLMAAHAVRFKSNAKGGRLIGGLAVIALGIAAIALVVVLGSTDSVKSELSPTLSGWLWHGLRASVAGIALVGVYWAITAYGRVRLPEWIIAAGLVSMVVAAAVWLFANDEVRLDDAGLRILWHLVKGTAAAAVLLWGCHLVFGQRAGMVLLHGGVGLLMLGEMLTGYLAEESQMTIPEGATVNYASDIRTTELALTDRSNPTAQRVTVVPQRFLANAKPDDPITHDELPVDLRVVRYYANSMLGEPEDADNPATAGAGLKVAAINSPPVSGIDGSRVNQPSAYVELLDKESGESLGVYLASIAGSREFGFLREQPVEIDGKTFALELRFKRVYKDYAVKLLDFQFDRYTGTQVAKDFRSVVRLLDPARSVDREVSIWMNNPLRYGGETLYQSSFDDVTEKTTVLQVVSNRGWLIPYLSCMVVAVGMLAHFGLTLGRFTRRRVEEELRQKKSAGAPKPSAGWASPLIVVPAVAAVLWAGYLSGKARPAKDAPGEMRLNAFAALPLADGGRIKPYDTVARNTLQALSARQTVLLGKEELPEDASSLKVLAHRLKREERMPAIQWMLDVVSGKDGSRDYRVFRIENLEVLDLLGLDRRPGSYRYSYDEVTGGDNREKIGKQLDLLDGLDPDNRSVFQTKVAELGTKLTIYHRLANAFAPLPIRADSSKIIEDIQFAILGALKENQARSAPPRAIPPADPGGEWLSHYEGQLNSLFQRFPGVGERCVNQLRQFFLSQSPRSIRDLDQLVERFESAGDAPATRLLGAALDAYRAGEVADFNRSVRELRKALEQYESAAADPKNAQAVAGLAAAERVSLAKARFEAFFANFSPAYYCLVSYLVALLVCMASWLAAPRTLGRAATAIIVVTFLVHTFAVVGRIYISGRPPVTNLYSSAVFIGWAVVLAGLAIEAMFKFGIGNVLAAVSGWLTLQIAYFMGLDGDTFTVLQAVLDTQFWLATHVVCVTLGYAATYVAGGLAIIYLIRSHMLGNLDAESEKALPRMIYGTLCFAILFSFVGTVLGGLWGDNSWGRFWGWDPKENGALIIVLWNALVLHARWGKMISSSGLAALAIFGNVCTTWSWFGTNELGVGLHAYGGLSDGVSLELFIVRAVVYTHPWLIAIALVPRAAWRNLFGRAAQPTA